MINFTPFVEIWWWKYGQISSRPISATDDFPQNVSKDEGKWDPGYFREIVWVGEILWTIWPDICASITSKWKKFWGPNLETDVELITYEAWRLEGKVPSEEKDP